MSEHIILPPPLLIGIDLRKLIDKHNERVVEIWLRQGSNAKPFTPSTVPAALADLSRVVVAEHSGSPLQLYRDAS
jgi:hypothetical protein